MSLELNIFQNLKYNGQAFNNENLPIVYVPFHLKENMFLMRSRLFPVLPRLSSADGCQPFQGAQPTRITGCPRITLDGKITFNCAIF
jgi:hypothetical protein